MHVPAAPQSKVGPARDSGEFSEERVLNGHRFLFPLLQETAFNTTHVGIRQDGGVYTAPRWPLGALGKVDLNGVFLKETLDLGIRLHDRVGFFGAFTGNAVSGTDEISALCLGATFAAGGTIGSIVKVARLERTGAQLAVRVFGSMGTGTKLTGAPLLKSLLERAPATLNDVMAGKLDEYVITDRGSHEYGGSLHGAQALGRYLSLQASARFARWGTFEKAHLPSGDMEVSATGTDLQGALAVALDGFPAHVPIATMLEYKVVWSSGEASTGMSHFASLGIYYSGQRNLQVGIALGTELDTKPLAGFDAEGHPASSGKPLFVHGHFMLRYIWPSAVAHQD